MASRKVTKKVDMKCVFCKRLTEVDKTIKAVLCEYCVARLIGTPMEIGKFPKDTVKKPKAKKGRKVKVVKKKIVKKVVRKKTAKTKAVSKTSGDNLKKFGGSPGRGWHLKKKFVAPNGNVYKFGELVKKK